MRRGPRLLPRNLVSMLAPHLSWPVMLSPVSHSFSSCTRVSLLPASAQDMPCLCSITFVVGWLKPDLQQLHASACGFLGVYLSVWYEQVSLLRHWSEREPPHCSPFGANCSTANGRRR